MGDGKKRVSGEGAAKRFGWMKRKTAAGEEGVGVKKGGTERAVLFGRKELLLSSRNEDASAAVAGFKPDQFVGLKQLVRSVAMEIILRK